MEKNLTKKNEEKGPEFLQPDVENVIPFSKN